MGAIGLTQTSVTIASGQSLSAAIPIGEDIPVGIVMPATWTAAALTFQVSVDGGTTWVEMYDNTGTAVSLTVDINRYVQLAASSWFGINHIKIRSGTSGSPVTQGADRILTLVSKKL